MHTYFEKITKHLNPFFSFLLLKKLGNKCIFLFNSKRSAELKVIHPPRDKGSVERFKERSISLLARHGACCCRIYSVGRHCKSGFRAKQYNCDCMCFCVWVRN